MKKWIIVMYSILFIPQGHAQHLEGYLSIDTRAGYSTNTLLNPFFGEWDRTSQSGYIFTSPVGILNYNYNNLSADLTAGGVFNSFLDDRKSLSGIFGLMSARYRFNDSFLAGFESGGSRVSSSFDRTIYWIQPVISWSPTLFTRLNARLGSSFRSYDSIPDNEMEETEGQTRFDLYGLEVETWPGFRWQVMGNLYGDLSAPTDNLSLAGTVGHQLTGKLRLSVRAVMDQYSFQFISQNGGLGGGFPPIGGPGGGVNGTTVEDTDRIFRAGVTANYQIHRNVTLHAGAEQLSLNSSLSDESIKDYHLSAGLRFTLKPSFRNRDMAEPNWRLNSDQAFTLIINHSGDGQLYLLGDFNDWNTPGIPLRKQSNRRYVVQLSLDPGVYEYKILLIEGGEERWIDFTDETFKVSDGFGGENGLILIE